MGTTEAEPTYNPFYDDLQASLLEQLVGITKDCYNGTPDNFVVFAKRLASAFVIALRDESPEELPDNREMRQMAHEADLTDKMQGITAEEHIGRMLSAMYIVGHAFQPE